MNFSLRTLAPIYRTFRNLASALSTEAMCGKEKAQQQTEKSHCFRPEKLYFPVVRHRTRVFDLMTK